MELAWLTRQHMSLELPLPPNVFGRRTQRLQSVDFTTSNDMTRKIINRQKILRSHSRILGDEPKISSWPLLLHLGLKANKKTSQTRLHWIVESSDSSATATLSSFTRLVEWLECRCERVERKPSVKRLAIVRPCPNPANFASSRSDIVKGNIWNVLRPSSLDVL